MPGVVEYLTLIEYMWRYRRVDFCLHNKAFELGISLLTCHMTWVFCLMIRNTPIMHFKELKKYHYKKKLLRGQRAV